MCIEFSSLRKGGEMTELVTLNAAREAQQLALLVQRPEALPREQSQHSISISQAAVEPDVRRGPQQTEAGAQGDSQNDSSQRRDRQDHGLTGPSRPRIEIRSFAVEEKSPSYEPAPYTNVVPDVSLPNAGSSAPRPQPTVIAGGAGSAPNNSLATSPILNGRTQAEVEVAIAQQAVQTAAFAQSVPDEADVRTVRLEAAARAVRANAILPRYGAGLAPAPEAQVQKYSDKADAQNGVGSGEQQVPQKYFGKGSEAVVGQFAARPDQPQKYADKTAAQQQGVSFEDGSGEAKYYDKVAQTEADFAGGDSSADEKSFYDRAQEYNSSLNEGSPNVPDSQRKSYSEANTESAPAAKTSVTVTVHGKPVTVQVTA